MINLAQDSHRLQPFDSAWVLVSPQRTARRGKGCRVPAIVESSEYDPNCYICPGNARANGKLNAKYAKHLFSITIFPR